jgi:hypothetical protein
MDLQFTTDITFCLGCLNDVHDVCGSPRQRHQVSALVGGAHPRHVFLVQGTNRQFGILGPSVECGEICGG